MMLFFFFMLTASAQQNPSGSVQPANAPETTGTAESDQSLVQRPAESISQEELLQIRDPFLTPTRFLKQERLKQLTSAENKIPEIERLSVYNLKLKGVMTGPKRLRAMLTSDTGKTYIVGLKDKVGNRKGYVTKITPTAIEILETVQGLTGKDERLITELKLNEKDNKPIGI